MWALGGSGPLLMTVRSAPGIAGATSAKTGTPGDSSEQAEAPAWQPPWSAGFRGASVETSATAKMPAIAGTAVAGNSVGTEIPAGCAVCPWSQSEGAHIALRFVVNTVSWLTNRSSTVSARRRREVRGPNTVGGYRQRDFASTG